LSEVKQFSGGNFSYMKNKKTTFVSFSACNIFYFTVLDVYPQIDSFEIKKKNNNRQLALTFIYDIDSEIFFKVMLGEHNIILISNLDSNEKKETYLIMQKSLAKDSELKIWCKMLRNFLDLSNDKPYQRDCSHFIRSVKSYITKNMENEKSVFYKTNKNEFLITYNDYPTRWIPEGKVLKINRVEQKKDGKD